MPLNIILIPIGSAGDVYPFLAMGICLRDRGHKITIATSAKFEPLVKNLGLEFVSLGTAEQFDQFVQDPNLWHPWHGFFKVAQWGMLDTMRPIYQLIEERLGCHAGQTIVVAPVTALGARIAHDALGVALVTVVLQPMLLRSFCDSPRIPYALMGNRVPRVYKQLQFWMFDKLIADRTLASEVNRFRSELGLHSIKRLLKDWWLSPQRVVGLFPDWFGPRQPDWPQQLTTTDFPLWDERPDDALPGEVTTYLNDGEPPIVITPGSAMAHGGDFFGESIEACRQLGRRAILLTRYTDQLPSSLPRGIVHFKYVPFSRLLRKSAALIHHGGIGSMSQALAAGIPQLVMPMAHDQFDNASRVKRIGVGRSIERRQFRRNRIAAAVGDLLSSAEVSKHCREIADRLKDSSGAELAAVEIENAAPKRLPN